AALVTAMNARGTLDQRIDRALSSMKAAAPEVRTATLEWLQRRPGLAEKYDRARSFRLMAWDQGRELARHGVSFGCHTMTHPILTNLPAAQIESELRLSRSVIEQHLESECRTFAYPNGDFDARSIDALKAQGFDAACTQQFGANRPGADL